MISAVRLHLHRTLVLASVLLCGAGLTARSQEPDVEVDTTTIRTVDTPSVSVEVDTSTLHTVDTIGAGDTTSPSPDAFPGPQRADGTYGTIPLRNFFFPRPLEVWDRQWLLGTTLTIIPREVAEEKLRQAPMIDGRLEFGLPLNFHLRGRLATNVLTTYGGIGMGWNARFGRRLALGVDMEAAYWYGFAKFEGFDITAMGALAVPTLSVGYALDEVLFSLHGDLQIALWRRTESDGINVTQDVNTVAGYSGGLIVEQPLVGQRNIAVGVRLNYARQTYQAWLAFATFNEYLLYPEFSLHLLF